MLRVNRVALRAILYVNILDDLTVYMQYAFHSVRKRKSRICAISPLYSQRRGSGCLWFPGCILYVVYSVSSILCVFNIPRSAKRKKNFWPIHLFLLLLLCFSDYWRSTFSRLNDTRTRWLSFRFCLRTKKRRKTSSVTRHHVTRFSDDDKRHCRRWRIDVWRRTTGEKKTTQKIDIRAR